MPLLVKVINIIATVDDPSGMLFQVFTTLEETTTTTYLSYGYGALALVLSVCGPMCSPSVPGAEGIFNEI